MLNIINGSISSPDKYLKIIYYLIHFVSDCTVFLLYSSSNLSAFFDLYCPNSENAWYCPGPGAIYVNKYLILNIISL